MPVLHVFANLLRDTALAVVLFIECSVHMVDDSSKVALQGVVVNWALSVLVNAVVDVRNGCLCCPVGNAHSRVFDNLADDLWLEGTAVSEDPVGLVVRHCCPLSVLLVEHLLDDLSPVLVAGR